MASSLFTKERTIYWPTEFVDLAAMLKGQNEKGQTISTPVYGYNTWIMVVGATLGVLHKRKREVGKERQEITTTTFASQNLESYIFLIPMLGKPEQGVDLLRPENEEELIREFERYAAGGLEVLRGLFDDSAGRSSELVLQQEVLRVLNMGNLEDTNVPIKLF